MEISSVSFHPPILCATPTDVSEWSGLVMISFVVASTISLILDCRWSVTENTPWMDAASWIPVMTAIYIVVHITVQRSLMSFHAHTHGNNNLKKKISEKLSLCRHTVMTICAMTNMGRMIWIDESLERILPNTVFLLFMNEASPWNGFCAMLLGRTLELIVLPEYSDVTSSWPFSIGDVSCNSSVWSERGASPPSGVTLCFIIIPRNVNLLKLSKKSI